MKEFLSQRGFSFIDRDVSTDQQAFEELENLGYLTTPVTTIDGEVIVGFDRKRLEERLG
ncbi:MAG: glutaredoxin family protein [Chloroflexota bacterium]